MRRPCRHEQETAAGVGTGRAAFSARAALGWTGPLLARPGPGRLGDRVPSVGAGPPEDSPRLAPGGAGDRRRGGGPWLRALGAALGTGPALGGSSDRGEASRTGRRTAGRRRRGRGRARRPIELLAGSRRPRGPGTPPIPQLG